MISVAKQGIDIRRIIIIVNKILSVGIAVMLFLGIMATTVQATSEKDQELIAAAGKGDIEEVKSLIKVGADVNAKKNNGYTALM